MRFAVRAYDVAVVTFEVLAVGTMLGVAMTLSGTAVVVDKLLSLAGRFQWDGRR